MSDSDIGPELRSPSFPRISSDRISRSRTPSGFLTRAQEVEAMLDTLSFSPLPFDSLSYDPMDSDDEKDHKLDDTDKFESALLRYSRAIMKGATDFDPDRTEDLEKAISVTKQTVISLYHGANLKSAIKGQNLMQELLKVKAEKKDMANKLESEAARVVILKAKLSEEKQSSSRWLSAYCKEELKSHALSKQVDDKKKVDRSKKRKRMVGMWERAEKAKFDDDQ